MFKQIIFKILGAIGLITIVCNIGFAQIVDSTALNKISPKIGQCIYIESSGPGLLVSANYDARFLKGNNGLGYRVGVGFFYLFDDFMFSLPAQINYLIGSKSKYLELGLGITYASKTSIYNGLSTTSLLGFRYQPINGGFNFRIFISPLINKQEFNPLWAGFSLGHTF